MTEEEQRAKWREASARYRQTAKGRIAVINAKRASKMRDPHKHTARMILGKAVARGHITKPELCVEANSDCNGRIEGIYKRRGSTKKLTKCIGRLSHYEVIAPEIVTYESIVTYQDGPPEAWRCWGEFLAQNAQEAIKMALKHEDFKEWVAEARADGLNPYQGVEAKRFKCEHGICLGCNEECETCNAALEEVYK